MNVNSQSQLRNIKDFLLVYNGITEHCFDKCITNMNSRSMTYGEELCVHNCTMRYITSGYRLMKEFASRTPEMVQRRNEEALEQAKKAGLTMESSINDSESSALTEQT